ncbi:uncharacterized protein CBL_11193 [Carabus blaptoides fortunei]
MADVNALPPGWDCKYDTRTSRYYFINHFTKVTTWEDPRIRYRQIHGTPNPAVEHIPLQHGSPETRRNYVYPSQTCPQPAFQMPKTVPVQDLSNLSAARMSPANVSRASSSTPAHKASPLVTQVVSRMQETSLTPAATDTEQSVAKISTMFPTVSETHIRLLLKKYMKSIFPQVDENILLEALGNNENNVQKASEALKEMGFEKRDIKLAKAKSSRQEAAKQAELAAVQATPPPKMLNSNEKKAVKTTLQNKYKDIPERVIVIALESVDYNESRACQILDIMMQEENSPKSRASPKKDTSPVIVSTSYGGALKKSKSSLITPSPSNQTLRTDKLDAKQTRRTKERNHSARGPIQDSKLSDGDSYKSVYLVETSGPDSSLAKGSDNGMLLEDYVSWDGPDPGLREGSRGLAKGPNAQLLMSRTYQPCGPNSDNCKGPARGLVQGSIYTQLQVVGGESRGK